MIAAADVFRVFQSHRGNAIVISTGTAGRHWRDFSTNEKRDLTLGGAMGQTAAAALGVALGLPDERVVLFDAEGALLMNLGILATIAGKTHIVYSGVTLQNAARGWRDTRVAESEVRMLPLDERDIAWYVSTGEPRDKAGAYAVQGIGAMFIDSIHGSYTNVVGLPLALLFQMLRRAGIDPLKRGSGE